MFERFRVPRSTKFTGSEDLELRLRLSLHGHNFKLAVADVMLVLWHLQSTCRSLMHCAPGHLHEFSSYTILFSLANILQSRHYKYRLRMILFPSNHHLMFRRILILQAMLTLTLSLSSAFGICKVRIPSTSSPLVRDPSTGWSNQIVREKDERERKVRSVEMWRTAGRVTAPSPF